MTLRNSFRTPCTNSIDGLENNNNPYNSKIDDEKPSDTENASLVSKPDAEQIYAKIQTTIGSVGWMELLSVFPLMVFGKIFHGAATVLPVFTNAEVDFRCRSCLDTGISYNDTKIPTEKMFLYPEIPGETKCGVEESKLDTCKILESYEFSNNGTADSCPNEKFNINENPVFLNCQPDQLLYDQSIYSNTLFTEFHLGCGQDNKYLNDVARSTYFVGYIFGVLLAGNLNYSLGRKNTGLIFAILAWLSFVYNSMAPSMMHIVLARLLIGATLAAWCSSSYCYCMEMIPRQYKCWVNIVWGGLFSLGCALNSVFAIYFRDWRNLTFYISLLALPLIVLSYFLQIKSWRWLLSRGEYGKACKILFLIGQKQKKKKNWSDEDEIQIKNCVKKLINQPTQYSLETSNKDITVASKAENDQSKDHDVGYLEILKVKPLWHVHFQVFFLWFGAAMCYYGTTFSSGKLPGSTIFNNAMMGLMDIPGYFLMLLSNNKKIGRKGMIVSGFLVTFVTFAISSILIYLDPCQENAKSNLAVQSLAFLGKFTIIAAFQLSIQWNLEIYSVDISGIGYAFGVLGGRISSIASSFVVSLGLLKATLIFALCSLISALVGMTIKETRGKDVPLRYNEMLR